MRPAQWCGLAVAGGRALLGIAALVAPERPARPWVGSVAARTDAVRVMARALGGRDVAIGAGALWSLSRADTGPRVAAGWVAAGALADGVDTVTTVMAWKHLPARGRLAVLALAGGSAVLGAVAAGELAGG